MKVVFVSYKREDEPRVGRLVRALEDAGFSVWWNRGLGGGEANKNKERLSQRSIEGYGWGNKWSTAIRLISIPKNSANPRTSKSNLMPLS